MQSRAQTKWITVCVIVSMSLMLIASMMSTGNLESPYLGLWIFAAVFAAMTGLSSLVPALLCVIGYGGYLWHIGTLTTSTSPLFGLSLVLPVAIGYLIWSRRFQAQDKSNQAVTALAKELNQESNKSEIIINAIADGVILIDAGGIIQLINPAAQRIIGWGTDDATKLDYRSVLKLTDKLDTPIDSQLDPVQQCLRTNQVIIADKLGIRTVSGKQLTASVLASPLSQTASSGVIIVFRDTTSQHAEEQEQAEFISTASHEMRTPVAAIEGYLGLALNTQTATIDEKARMYLTKAQDSAHHLGNLFQDLLDISKVEDGRLSSKPTIVDITSFVRSLLEDFTSQFSEKGLNLAFAPDMSATTVQTITPIFYANADIDHLREIVSNLITNAIKYTKQGDVLVNVTGDDSHVYISITDSGIGIPAEDIPHLFQKFYRVDNSDTREIGGTGLGLYLARRLIETMSGHLNVTSIYGKGSTFTIDLPRVSKEAAQLAQQQVGVADPQPAIML